MRLTIILLLVSAVCFGQPANYTTKAGKSKALNLSQGSVDTLKVDSLALPIFSTKEVLDYLYRIEKVAASIKNLRLPNDQEYTQLVAEMNMIIIEMDKKRKGK